MSSSNGGGLRASSPTPLPPLPALALAAAYGTSDARAQQEKTAGAGCCCAAAASPPPPAAAANAAAASTADHQQRRLRLEQRRALQGPTPWSNWVIPGRLLAGGFPASPDDVDTRHTLLRLMGAPQSSGGGSGTSSGSSGGGGGGGGGATTTAAPSQQLGSGCGVTAFVCLQSELDPRAPPASWRRGAALRPYPRDAAALLAEAAEGGSGNGNGGVVLELPALGPSAVVSCYGDGPPAFACPPASPPSASSSSPWSPPQPPPLDPFTATADAVGPGGSAAAAAAAAHGRPPVPRDSPSCSPRTGAPGSKLFLKPARRVDFLHLPIPDGGTAPDAALSALADDVCARLKAGHVVYAHCWGGHGRTGSLVAVVLARLYGLSAEQALRATQACHDARVFPQGTRSPQTSAQRQQVVRVVGMGSAGLVGMAAGAGAAAGGLPAAGQLRQEQQQQPSQQQPKAAVAAAGSEGGGGGGGARAEVVATASAAAPPGAEALRKDFGVVGNLLRKRARSPNNQIPSRPAV
jgi:hypothetical protein